MESSSGLGFNQKSLLPRVRLALLPVRFMGLGRVKESQGLLKQVHW